MTWYRGQQKFTNGITWFRLGRRGQGPGLWWKDTRKAAPDPAKDVLGWKLRLGPYLVKVIW